MDQNAKWMENKLSDAEMGIMQLLWRAEKPLRAGDIVHLLPERGWKTQTVHVLLNRLCDKGYVTADREGYYHHFTPLVSERDYAAFASASLVKKMGRSVRALVASLIDGDSLSREDILELSEMLEKKRAAFAEEKEDGNDPA